MNATLRDMWTRFAERWKATSPNLRRNLIIIAVAVLAALSAILWLVSRPHYVTIMSGLDNKSLGQVQSQLQQLKIPDEIVGSSVLVPQAKAEDARVQLSMAGLPQSGYIGYASVGSSLGMTQDQFNIQVLDALQQSLNATISSIDGVESAQVHIVMPQEKLFVSQPTSDAKASVFVTLGTGVQLSAQQVAGIQQLVAHSVKGLSVSNVSVVNQNGVTLSATGSVGGAASVGAATTELGVRDRLENDLTQKLTSDLARIVGAGNAVVIVHADVTFNQTSTKSHTLQNAPGQSSGFITSQEVTKSQNSSVNNPVGGPAGQTGNNPNNPPVYAGASGNSGNSTSSETQTTTNYAESYKDQQTTGDPVQILGYKVGVLLNSNDKSINTNVVQQIKAFVTNVVGQSQPGGSNNVTVSPVPFNQAPVAPTLQSSKSNYMLYGLGALALLLLVGGTVAWRRRGSKDAARDIDAMVQDTYEQELEELPLTQDELLRKQLVGMAQQRPDDFASLLRTWLAE